MWWMVYAINNLSHKCEWDICHKCQAAVFIKLAHVDFICSLYVSLYAFHRITRGLNLFHIFTEWVVYTCFIFKAFDLCGPWANVKLNDLVFVLSLALVFACLALARIIPALPFGPWPCPPVSLAWLHVQSVKTVGFCHPRVGFCLGVAGVRSGSRSEFLQTKNDTMFQKMWHNWYEFETTYFIMLPLTSYLGHICCYVLHVSINVFIHSS